jgi:hypothetical protein
MAAKRTNHENAFSLTIDDCQDRCLTLFNARTTLLVSLRGNVVVNVNALRSCNHNLLRPDKYN